MSDLSMPRETGAEQAAEPCPKCGGPRQVIESPYGSTAPSPCPNCWPAAPDAAPLEVQKAAAASVPPPGNDGEPEATPSA